jgi:hypothetical protein
LAAETEPLPNPVAGDSERDARKSKKRESLLKPKSELPPNRISESAFSGFAMSEMSFVGDPASSTSRTVLPNDGIECDQQESNPSGRLGKWVLIAQSCDWGDRVTKSF